MQLHWKSVEKLANVLFDRKHISKDDAFDIIEREIPEELKVKAKAELSRTTTEKLKEMLKNNYTKD